MFRVRALNKWGWGKFSDIITVQASSTPVKMDPPVTSVSSVNGDLIIQWNEPNNRNSPIDKYMILIRNKLMTDWPEEQLHCDGTDPVIVSNRYCTIPMSVLTSATYNLKRGDLIVVKVRAHNLNDWGEYSNPNSFGASVRTEPAQMIKPVRGSQTSENEVHVVWSAQTTAIQTGDSPILSYKLEWDQGNGGWETLIGFPSNSLLTEYIVSTGVNAGAKYQFRVTSRNVYGFGLLTSEIADIYASDVPERPAPLSTLNQGDQIEVSWEEPYDNSDTIIGYEVQFRKSDGTFITISQCNGLVAPAKDDKECLIDMSIFTNPATFNLQQGDFIVGRVKAKNSIEFGDYSEVKEQGAIVKVIPYKMSAPYLGTDIALDKLEILWQSLSGVSTGSDDIDSYQLDFDNNTNQGTWTPLVGYDNAFQLVTSFVKSDADIVENKQYYFRVRAHNNMGWGEFSDPVAFMTYTYPDQPTAVKTQIINMNLRVSWTAPDPNYKPIDAYKIVIQNIDTTLEYEDTINCDGSSSIIISQLYCEIPLQRLRLDPFYLQYNQEIIARVKAHNLKDWGDYSDYSTVNAHMQTEPAKMTLPKRDTTTNSKRLVVYWDSASTPLSQGGASITSYNLIWDAGTSGVSWFQVIGDEAQGGGPFTATQFTVTSGVSMGQDYRFKVRAQNMWGWGSYSDYGTIRASEPPAKMDAPVTSLDSATGGVRISWTQPLNNGNTITQYKIEIQSKLLGWYSSNFCNGANTAIVINRYCIVPMSEFTSALYSLVLDDMIYVQVTAYNTVDFGEWSSVNVLGQKVRTVPKKMSDPLRGEATSTNKMHVKWSPSEYPNNGNSQILSYNLVWDAGTGNVAQDLVGNAAIFTNLTYTITTGISVGIPYTFKIRARNIYGWGEFSTLIPIIASDKPAQPIMITTYYSPINLKKIRIDFTPPVSNGALIEFYDIRIQDSTGKNYFQELSSCSGLDSTVKAQTYCDVLVTTLRGAPFNLQQGMIVKAIISAQNSNGMGLFSQVNIEGAAIQTEPGQVPYFSFDPDQSDLNNVWLTWNEPTDILTGGSDITQYLIQKWNTVDIKWDDLITLTAPVSSYKVQSLSGGVTYRFRIAALNLHGQGPYPLNSDNGATATNILITKTQQKPDTPMEPETSDSVDNVKISWIPPSDNFADIDAYQILIGNHDATDFIEIPSLCNGANPLVVSEHYCVFKMSDLTSKTSLQLELGSKILAKVKAHNSRGWGDLSTKTSLVYTTAKYKPQIMHTPSRIDASTDERNIKVQWSTITGVPKNGGSPITSYNLQWDKGTGGFMYYDLLGVTPYSTLNDYTVTTGVQSGRYYRFQVRARNIYGWGDFSIYAPVQAVTKPSVMLAPTTVNDETTGNVIISWIAPSNGGDPISAYNVYIGNSGYSNYIKETTYCGSTNMANMLTQLQCSVPMTVLTSSTYNLQFDNIVKVKVSAQNAYLEQDQSPENNVGAKIRRTPNQMAKVQLVSRTLSSMIVKWIPFPLVDSTIGNSPITGYDLRWDSGTGSTIYQLTETLATSQFQVTGLTGGRDYKFKVRAKNIYGYGDYSDIETFEASDVPSIMAIVQTSTDTVDPKKVRIDWAAPLDSFEPITEYSIQFLTVDGDLVEDNTNCNGQDPTILYCTILMSRIRQLTSQPYDTLIQVRAQAKNLNGWSSLSQFNTLGVVIQTEPLQMTDLRLDIDNSDNTKITLKWDALPLGVQTGGVSIIRYEIEEYDQTNSIWVPIGSSGGTSLQLTPVNEGEEYEYQIRAVNKYGEGPYSASFIVTAGQKPEAPPTPTALLNGIYIQVTWPVTDNNNLLIDAYQVQVKTAEIGSVFEEDKNYCDGSDSAIVAARECMIPMQILRQSPFNLTYKANVIVKVRAHNERGWSDYSTQVSGPQIQTEPLQMSLPREGSLTNTKRLQIEWDEVLGDSKGGSDIVSYNLYWDQGYDSWRSVIGEFSQYTGLSYIIGIGITPGASYKFKVRAENKWGWGPFSDEKTIIASGPPAQI